MAGNWDVVWYYSGVHMRITLSALVIGTIVAFPLGLIGYRWRQSYPPILGVANVLYTIPSLALIVIIGGFFGTMQGVKAASGNAKVPQVFIDGKLVGGSDQLEKFFSAGS